MIYCLKEKVLVQIKKTLYLPETGGILGVNINDRRTVTAFHFDSTGKTEGNTYTPDVDTLNRVIAEWAEDGIEFIGFVHSHPKGGRKLSPPDVEYANEIMRACNMAEILMMIYLPDTQELYPYVLTL